MSSSLSCGAFLAAGSLCGEKRSCFRYAALCLDEASLLAQTVKNLPAMLETWVRSLGQEDPLEKGKAIHSSILAWRIPWTEEPGKLQSMGLQVSQRVGHS